MKTGTCILTFVVLVLSSLPQSARSSGSNAAETKRLSREGQMISISTSVFGKRISNASSSRCRIEQSIELNGLVTTHKIWDGRAQWEEIEADGPMVTGKA